VAIVSLQNFFKTNGCTVCTPSSDNCRYLAGALPLNTKPLLQNVLYYNAHEEFDYITKVCLNDMSLTPSMPHATQLRNVEI